MADEQLIKPRELPAATTVFADDAIMTDDGVTVGKATPVQIVNAGAPVPTEAEAIAGTDNSKRMTPLTVKQVLDNVTAPSVARAQAWAESPTNPDPAIPDSRSSKSWAEDAAAARDETVNQAPFAVKDAADFFSRTELVNGARYWAKDGMAWDVLANGTGQFIHPVTGQQISVVVSSDGTIHGDAFGAKGDGVTDDTPSIQLAFTVAGQFLTLPNAPSGTNSRPWYSLKWSRKVYYCATPVNLPTHVSVEMNGAAFMAPPGGRIFNGHASSYRHYWVGPGVLWGDDVEALHIDAANLNNAFFLFRDIDLSTQTRTIGKWAINITSRSSRIIFENCNARLCQFAFRTDSDFTYFDKGWWSGHVGTNPKPGDHASASFHGNDVHMRDIVFVPEPQGVTRQARARWIDKRNRKIQLDGCHFGAENSGVPVIYEFYSATYDAANRSMDSIISMNFCQLACGSSSRPDAGVVVLQSGVLPGFMSFRGCEGIALAPVVSAYGYDELGTPATQNSALRTALQSAPSVYRGNVQVVVDTVDFTKDTTTGIIVPYCMRGYLSSPYGDRTYSVFAPTIGAPIGVFEVSRATALTTGQRAWNDYDVKITLNGSSTLADSFVQEKVYRLSVLSNSTNAMVGFVSQISFWEKGRIPANEHGDIIISMDVMGSPTSTNAMFSVTLAELPTDPHPYDSVQIQIVSKSGGSMASSLSRTYEALYPA